MTCSGWGKTLAIILDSNSRSCLTSRINFCKLGSTPGGSMSGSGSFSQLMKQCQF